MDSLKPDATARPSIIASVIRRLSGFWTSSTNSTAGTSPPVVAIGAAEARRLLARGEALLVDVREAHEHAQEHIKGAKLVPLSRFKAHDFSGDCARKNAAIFYCRSGARTARHVRHFARTGFAEVYVLDGGLIGWKRAGLATTA
ncbi:MAG: rhodanese-like domain-containing protein [Alphaproteobacteria bacterium]|nr:rhodanese-like domain-containing protein [Alphaproteobacteria bacterium]MDE2013853.1 rhodanese-like domain-containing protein [Alphaproteobacteria bacterium]MDE2074730.1 rhodanese-like domain-containing protein [Alphaproteobacteria bacterium]MDE2350553.1 rhodanese-like domain-containing protein [Alphaproteobacteria bacterium]